MMGYCFLLKRWCYCWIMKDFLNTEPCPLDLITGQPCLVHRDWKTLFLRTETPSQTFQLEVRGKNSIVYGQYGRRANKAHQLLTWQKCSSFVQHNFSTFFFLHVNYILLLYLWHIYIIHTYIFVFSSCHNPTIHQEHNSHWRKSN